MISGISIWMKMKIDTMFREFSQNMPRIRIRKGYWCFGKKQESSISLHATFTLVQENFDRECAIEHTELLVSHANSCFE